MSLVYHQSRPLTEHWKNTYNSEDDLLGIGHLTEIPRHEPHAHPQTRLGSSVGLHRIDHLCLHPSLPILPLPPLCTRLTLLGSLGLFGLLLLLGSCMLLLRRCLRLFGFGVRLVLRHLGSRQILGSLLPSRSLLGSSSRIRRLLLLGQSGASGFCIGLSLLYSSDCSINVLSIS
jgi:hypothetical protein